MPLQISSITDWANVGQLDQNFNYIVKYALKNAVKDGYKPISFET